MIAFTPMPFSWETRHAQAEGCLTELRKHANAVVPLPNDSLLQMGGRMPQLLNALQKRVGTSWN